MSMKENRRGDRTKYIGFLEQNAVGKNYKIQHADSLMFENEQ